MKKKIKIIDLLNKIANGEEVPKTIIYNNYNYTFESMINNLIYFDDEYRKTLNDEVEILDEEEKNNFTGWKIYQDGKEVMSMDCSNQDEEEFEDIEECFAGVELEYNKNSLEYKINQLIKNQKLLIEKIRDNK